MSGLVSAASGHREQMNALLTDNKVIVALMMLLVVVNAFLMMNGYYDA